MKITIIATVFMLAILAIGLEPAPAQFPIKIPKIKIEKPKPEQPKSDATQTAEAAASGQTSAPDKGSGNIYSNQRPTSTPVFLKNSVYIQAVTHDEYWKMPNQKNHSSWVPTLRFSQFYDNENELNYTADYFNPDGSIWYSEKLKQDSSAADRTVRFQSASDPYELLKTKSTAGTGVYSFKITSQDSGKVLFQGKFKVGKFSTANRPDEKNKFEFFVDHDWLLPFGTIGFHHSDIELGGVPLYISVWLKGIIDAKELEGRIFYSGRQIATTKDRESGASSREERATGSAAPYSPLDYWQRWQFVWRNFRFDNNGTFNRDYYPGAHYADKNPGEYTVKIYRNGTQIRETSFSVGTDGRFVVPAYTNQIPLPYHTIILPVKVIGTTEKWNSAAWKTEAFYGNPLPGFSVP